MATTEVPEPIPELKQKTQQLVPCPDCTQAVSARAVHCPRCGANLTMSYRASDHNLTACGTCGRTISKSAVFCPYCGSAGTFLGLFTAGTKFGLGLIFLSFVIGLFVGTCSVLPNL